MGLLDRENGIHYRRPGNVRPTCEGTVEQRQYWGTGNIRNQHFF